jgi:magnesium-transporting ATPase (P-type)
MQTEFGKIARLTGTTAGTVSPLRKEIEHLSRWIGVLSVLIGVVFFAVGRLRGVPVWDAFIFAISIVVAMVPEGLLPTLNPGPRARHPAHGPAKRAHSPSTVEGSAAPVQGALR